MFIVKYGLDEKECLPGLLWRLPADTSGRDVQGRGDCAQHLLLAWVQGEELYNLLNPKIYSSSLSQNWELSMSVDLDNSNPEYTSNNMT